MTRKMKNSGIEWINEIPESWKVNRIKNIFTSGKGLSITKENLIDNGLAIVSYGQIHSKTNTGVTIEDDLFRFVDFKYQKYYSQCQVYQYDFIFADTSEDSDGCGNCVYKRDNSILFAGYHSIILHSIIPQDNRYLAYLFKTDCWRKQIREVASGVKVFSITQKALINSSVTVPPFEEQQKIANYLDKKCAEIDSLSSDIQSQISVLEDYKKSVITEAVTNGLNPDVGVKDSGIEWIGDIPKEWKVLRLKNIGDYRNGLTYSPLDLTDENKGTLVLRSSNVKNGEIVFEDNVYVSCSIRPELKVKQGDILICSRNGSRDLVGKNAIISDDIEASFGAFMMIFRCTFPKYMYYVLNSAIFSYYLGSFFTSTINQLTGNNFGNMKIVFCDNEAEQNQIVKYLDKKCTEIEGTIVEKKKQLEILEQYKKSLIYEYVTGKKEVIL